MNVSKLVYKIFYHWESYFSSLSILLIILFLKGHILTKHCKLWPGDKFSLGCHHRYKIPPRSFWIWNLFTLSAMSLFRFRVTVTPYGHPEANPCLKHTLFREGWSVAKFGMIAWQVGVWIRPESRAHHCHESMLCLNRGFLSFWKLGTGEPWRPIF